MAVVVTSRTSLLVAAVTVGLVFIPAVVGQTFQCTNTTLNNTLEATAAIKYILSPGYPDNYPSFTNCQWHITADLSSRVVMLTLIDFYLEESPSPSCSNDNVTIYDGSNTSSPRIQLLCGQVFQTQFTSTGPSMTVEFYSNKLNEFKGFEFGYTSLDKSDACINGILSAIETVKYITSPGYPKNYPSNMTCQWHITADLPSHVVMLKLLDFYLDPYTPSCVTDYVAIYDGSSTSSPRIQLLCGQVPITQFTSTGPSMTVVFHSDVRYNYKGFQFEYTSRDKSVACTNGILSANGTAKYITSPGYPSNYPSQMSCQWHITSDFYQQVVMLKLLDFYLEESPSCYNDYVAIYDGPSTSYLKTQLLCGQVPSAHYTSSDTSMTVVFNSDTSHNFRGFKFEYTSLVKSALCSNNTLVANRTAKYITSPNYPYNYPSIMRCQWHITADLASRVVMLKLLDFYLDGNKQSCNSDYVAIYDGSSTSSPKSEVLCGQVQITQFTSTGPNMTVEFFSDVSVTNRGFKFEYTSLDKSVLCANTTLVATGTVKYISSPRYPYNTPSYMICEWHITADLSSRVVVLKLLNFYLEKPSVWCPDYVIIYDGSSTSSPIIQSLCGRVEITQFTSTGPSMTVVFHADGSDIYRAFQFEYTSMNKSGACANGILSATATGKYSASPGYPSNYPSNTTCQWLITANLPSNVVVLKLLDFYLEESLSCSIDYVAIYDGSSTSSPRTRLLCGQVPVTQFISTGPSMTVVFHSDGSNNFRGFNFQYTSLDKSALCTGNTLRANGTAKYFTSPGYPDNYPSYVNCQWTIAADLSSSVVVLKVLDFYLEKFSSCNYDYVAIYDGYTTSSPRIQLLCGQVAITQIRSTGPSMTVVFYSDGINNFRGFKFEYTSLDKSDTCTDGILSATESGKYITSLGYPKNYPSNMDCQWHITADLYSRVVVLKLLDFYLEGVSPCNSDYVAIYDGYNTSSPRIQFLCGIVPITQFTSTGPSMTVVFHSDGSSNFRGFMFEYTSLDKSALCANITLVATETTKYITSPGYPNNYPSNVSCQWHITADLSSHVAVLKLLDFYLEGSSSTSCNYDYVAIYNGNRPDSPRIQLLCGQVSSAQFTSTGPSMTVEFHSDGSNNFRGFKFEYTSLIKSGIVIVG